MDDYQTGVIWDNMGRDSRTMLIKRCRWITAKGELNPTGRAILIMDWSRLSIAAKKIIQRNYLIKEPRS